MVQFEIDKYLALHGSENAYTSQLLEDLNFFIDNEYYHYALNIYHLLFMTVVYQTVLKAREWRRRKFENATILIYYRDLSRDKMLDTSQAFDFSKIPERSFMNFLKLFDADDNLVQDCKRLVDDRNERSHANGNYFSNAILFEELIGKYDEILSRIHIFYKKYLLQVLKIYVDNLNPSSSVTRDDLELDLILSNKLNLLDLSCLKEICCSKRKIHKQIRQILDNDYGLLE